jgi:hypothetical protein
MYWNKKDQTFRNKIINNAIARKTPYFRRGLCINHEPTNVKIIRVINQNDLMMKVCGLSYLDPQVCYQHSNVKLFSTALFNSKIDLVFTNYKGVVLTINKEINKDALMFRPKGAKFA